MVGDGETCAGGAEQRLNLPYQYLAIYEVETDDLPAAANAMTSTPMYIDPSLDRANTVAWYYTSITERKSR